MNRLSSLKWKLRAGAGLVLVTAALCAASVAVVTAADTKPETKTAKKTEKTPAAKTSKEKLTGAELYTIHCNRCHAERYATERTDAQWKTIMMHMQTRAQIPGKDATAILKYLQENN